MAALLRSTLVIFLLSLRSALAFPVYTAANGTTVLASARGSDVVLQPSFGGAAAA